MPRRPLNEIELPSIEQVRAALGEITDNYLSEPAKDTDLPTTDQVKTRIEERNKRRSYGKALKSTLNVLVVVAAVAVLAATLVFPVLQVSGNSMEPTLSNDDIILLLRTKEYETGDLVGFYYQNKLLIKRVIATEGDYVDITDDGTVSVNGDVLNEPYLISKALGTCDIELPYQVPTGKIFVMGDNRSISIDSRSTTVGCVEKEQIVGKILFRVWPLNNFSPID